MQDTYQLGDLPAGTQFQYGEENFLLLDTEAYMDIPDGYNFVASLTTGCLKLMSNAVQLRMTPAYRLWVCPRANGWTA